MKTVIRILFLLLMATTAVFCDVDVPYLTGRVSDYAQILTPDVRESLIRMLKEHEEKTTNQIAVLTIPTLDGGSIEDFAVRVFQEWKLGQKGIDNGLLIIVVPNDRKMRIEIGYGLEGTITDGTAGEIIRHVMTPKFKNGDYDGGITSGVITVIDFLESGELPFTAEETGGNDEFFSGQALGLTERILIGAFIFGIIGLFTVVGITTPGIGWFLYFFLIPFWAMFPIIVVGTRGAFICLVTYIIGFPIAKFYCKSRPWYKKAKKDLKKKGRASIGGFHFTSSSSGSSWSSGGSSFSGGGGSSGGGGASGSW